MAAVDRISELPESTLHHILSFLSHKQAIQTSVLSKPWRHVGPTRPKIELRDICFKKSGRASFLSVLDKILQRYYHQNLSVHEFILEIYWPESKSESEDQLVDVDLEKALFKGLKRLSLTNVHIKDEMLEKIIRSSHLIEYLLVSDCAGLKTIPVTIFQAEFLTELHLTGSHFTTKYLIFTAPELILIKRLKTLSLRKVYIAEETLEKVMCRCPLIQRLLLYDCVGLTNIKLIKNNNNNNLKSFSGNFYPVKTKSFEIDAPNIETIRIVDCPNWYGHDRYFFPRLKTLYLHSVKLSAELFESFSSSNFPSLEDLELEYCYGFQKIQLTVSSIKRLVILYHSFEPVVITVYAPNIHYFRLCTNFPPQLIFNTETTKEWESHVVMMYNRCFVDKDLMLSWLRQLSELLNSLREAHISLDVFPDPFENLKVEDPKVKPVPLEHVSIKGYYKSSSFPDFLNCLFLISRPRYIVMGVLYTTNTVNDLKKEKDKLAKLMTFHNKGKMKRGYLWGRDLMKRGYLWGRDLKEISMQVWDENSKGWHTVGVEGTCFPEFTTSYPRIRFSVKWRD